MGDGVPGDVRASHQRGQFPLPRMRYPHIVFRHTPSQSELILWQESKAPPPVVPSGGGAFFNQRLY